MINKFFSLLIIAIVTFLIQVSHVSAKELSPTASPTPAPIEYELPYPGILPGHPFYFLKNLRDNLVSFLISNPLKKAEFYLLQSDKSLQTAIYLSEQNKDSKLILQSLQKSEDYLVKAIEKTQEAKKQGIDTLGFSSKITIASLKHQELVLNLATAAKEDDKKNFELSLNSLKDLDRKVKALSPK